MATISTGGSGNWSSTTVNAPWTTGVPPVLGDKVNINSGHTVTIDGAYTAGDDTTTAINVKSGGILKASRSVSGSLTCYGTLSIETGGEVDFGKPGDAIPQAYTFDCYLNRSASMANNKYGIQGANASKFSAYGYTKKRVTRLTNTVAASATSIVVDNATGWAVGDTIYIGPTERSTATPTRAETRVIDASYAGGTTIPLTVALSYPHAATVGIANLTSNVNFRNYNDSYKGYVYIQYNNSNAASSIQGGYYSAINLGYYAASNVTLQGFQFRSTISTPSLYGTIVGTQKGIAFVSSVSDCRAWAQYTNTDKVIYDECAMVCTTTSACSAIYTANGVCCGFVGCLFAAYATVVMETAYSQGGQGCTFDDCDFIVSVGSQAMSSVALLDTFTNCRFYGRGELANPNSMTGFNFINCDIGYTHPLFTAASGTLRLIATGNKNNGFSIDMLNCNFISPFYGGDYSSGALNMDDINSASYLRITNVNADTTAQEKWVRYGAIFRDNSQIYLSRSTIRFEPKTAGVPLSETYYVAASSGETVKLGFTLRYDSTYGTATPPSVTVSGLGITPQTFTAGGSADTDYAQVVTCTPSSTGQLTITVSGQSTATTGKFWFGGWFNTPWVDWQWHYGYQYAPTTPKMTTDANISASYSTAIGYTGFARSSFDLTMTRDHSGQELYDWHQAYCVANRLDPALTGAPTALTLNGGSLTLNGGNLTGSGTLTTGSGRVVFTGSETIAHTISGNVRYLAAGTYAPNLGTATVDFNAAGAYDISGATISGTVTLTNSSGGSVTVRLPYGTTYVNSGPNITVTATTDVVISAPNLIDGTRVQIYNVTDAVELDNSVVTGGSGYSLTYAYSGAKTIRMRACYQSGVTAKYPIVTSGIVGAGGLTFTDAQADDDFYIGIGVDGQTVDAAYGGEITADFANIQIDVNDGADNTFDARRSVAWWRYITQTSSGIAQYDPEALQYVPDEFNIVIDGTLQIENVKAATLTITNGVWRRADGNNIIAATSNTIHWVPDNRVYTASALTDDLSDELMAVAIESGLTMKGALRLISAALAGRLSGAGTSSVVIRNAVADAKARITATVDQSGNRIAVATDTTD